MGVDPFLYTSFELTRNLLRWTSLHIAMNGGVHFGLAEIKFESGQENPEKPPLNNETIDNFDPERHPIPYKIYLQFLYSFTPAI
mmetsp:Transcript_21826/g.19363  ORF Transcript_21826/g.19363 Transcript_21826/m.19363 type:complete len:84 (+) Transcript_21826:275-526(+)